MRICALMFMAALRSRCGHYILAPMVFSERELTFTFAICYRPSVCRLSVVCRL